MPKLERFLRFLSRPFNVISIDAKFDEGHHRRTERGIDFEKILPADLLHLLLPGLIENGDDQLLAIEPEWGANIRHPSAGGRSPGGKYRLLSRLFIIAGQANYEWQHFEQAVHNIKQAKAKNQRS